MIDLAYAPANGGGDYANGKLRTATRHNWIAGVDNQVVETYTYGGTGGAASQRATTAEGQSVSQSFAWTDLGLPASVTYPQIAGIGPARTVSDGYSNGFLTSVPSYATGITYSVNAMLYQITHANNVVATYALDANRVQRVAGITTTGASSNNLALTPFAYDGAGDVKGIGSQTFVYDKVSRLVTGNILANNTPKTQSAVFDAFGNITSTTTTDWGVQTFSLNAATNRLNTPVTYDSAGSITYWGGFSYTWDPLGKLQAVSGTGINHTYLYTADGERISDRDILAGTTTLTIRGLDAKVLRIYGKSGSTWSWSKDYVYQQGLLLASVDASTTRQFDLDHLGTPRLVTGSGGTTLAIHDYYPFGMEAYGTTDWERMKFTGHERDLMGTPSQTDDLDNMHARFYNPNIARFLSPDLLRGDPHSPQSFNLFAYVKNRPMTYTDPWGLVPTIQIPCPDSAPPGAYCFGYPGPDRIPYNPYSTIIHWIYFGPDSGGSSGAAGRGIGTKPGTGPHPCSALSAVSFIHAHQDDAATVARQLTVPTQNVLGISGIESNWGQSNAAVFANNFFGLHGGADAPFANGVWFTRGGVGMSTFPSYLASARSFAAQWGAFVRGIGDPTQFAQALVNAGFNPGMPPLGNPDFVDDTAATINATAGRMECP